MTAPAVVKSSDLRRMAAIAKELGVCVSIEVEGKIIKVSPLTPEPEGSKHSLPTGGDALAEWRRRNEARFGKRSSK